MLYQRMRVGVGRDGAVMDEASQISMHSKRCTGRNGWVLKGPRVGCSGFLYSGTISKLSALTHSLLPFVISGRTPRHGIS